MADKKTKKKEEEEVETVAPISVEQMALDRNDGKYGLVPLAAIWAKELKKRQEHMTLSTAQLLEVALRDVLQGKVTWESVEDIIKAEKDGSAPKKK